MSDQIPAEAIEAAAKAFIEHGTLLPALEAASPHMHANLLSVMAAQGAALARVEALAEEWRYKGEFGWGAWQEGQGPDPEGYVLDTCSGELRAAIAAPTNGTG